MGRFKTVGLAGSVPRFPPRRVLLTLGCTGFSKCLSRSRAWRFAGGIAEFGQPLLQVAAVFGGVVNCEHHGLSSVSLKKKANETRHRTISMLRETPDRVYAYRTESRLKKRTGRSSEDVLVLRSKRSRKAAGSAFSLQVHVKENPKQRRILREGLFNKKENVSKSKPTSGEVK